ncbi:hypothetical protein D8S78_16090 [Natrialba swarupiae]|nr:hypothetical protein [Natrialba swarupiae]
MYWHTWRTGSGCGGTTRTVRYGPLSVVPGVIPIRSVIASGQRSDHAGVGSGVFSVPSRPDPHSGYTATGQYRLSGATLPWELLERDERTGRLGRRVADSWSTAVVRSAAPRHNAGTELARSIPPRARVVRRSQLLSETDCPEMKTYAGVIETRSTYQVPCIENRPQSRWSLDRAPTARELPSR